MQSDIDFDKGLSDHFASQELEYILIENGGGGDVSRCNYFFKPFQGFSVEYSLYSKKKEVG